MGEDDSTAAGGTRADSTAAGGGHGRGGAPADEERLRQAVSGAEQALIEFEIAVETFRVEVDNFAQLHHQRLGPMYARLDELDALIAEAVAARTGDPADIARAQQARAVAQPMPDVDELFGPRGAAHLDPDAPSVPFLSGDEPLTASRVRPSREAQRLYRELARRAHPDLAQESGEQQRRSAFIARVNDAYARGDEGTLHQLAEEWSAGPAPAEPVPAEATPEDRLRTLYARLEWLAARRDALAALSAELEQSAMGAMLRLAPQDPDGLLNEIAEQLLAEVAAREARLDELLHPAAD